jgi:dGTPase
MSKSDRRHPERPPSTQSDRDRVLYCPEFRRLASVTQVALAEGGLIFHNRLTHSLKVAQIAVLLGRKLTEESPDRARGHGGIDLDMVETAALAHDLGHPPFGHVTERRLDRLMLEKAALDGFEGNAQSFRIVTTIAVHAVGH